MALTLTINPTSGSGNATVSVTGNVNTGRNSRSKQITVRGSGVAAKTVTINQLGKTEFVEIDQASYTLAATATNLTITGKSNSRALTLEVLDAEMELMGVDAYYVSNTQYASGVAVTGDPGAAEAYAFEIRVVLQVNTTITQQTAMLKVTTESGADATVTFTHSAGNAYLNVDHTTLQMAADGTAVQFAISSNTSWTIS